MELKAATTAAAVVAVDHFTKTAATLVGRTDQILPVRNDAFALGVAQASVPVMVCAMVAMLSGYGVLVIRRARRHQLPAWVPGLVLGGAVANLADRAVFGAVRDFIGVLRIVVNLADAAIIVGLTDLFGLPAIGGRWAAPARSRAPRSPHATVCQRTPTHWPGSACSAAYRSAHRSP